MPPILTLSFRRLAPFAETLVVTALTTAAGFVILEHVEVPNVSLVFVIPVLAAAVRHGLAASLWATALSVLAYDYFFLLPLYRFTIADPADVVALVFLTIIALVASGLAARMHGQARKARREARVTSELYDLSAKIAGVLELDDLLWIAVTHLARAVDSEIVVLMPSNGRLVSRAAFPPDSELDRADVAAAQRCWDYDHRTGGVNDTVTPSPRFFLPVHTGRSEIGVIGVLPHDPSGRLQEGNCLGSIAKQALDLPAIGQRLNQRELGFSHRTAHIPRQNRPQRLKFQKFRRPFVHRMLSQSRRECRR